MSRLVALSNFQKAIEQASWCGERSMTAGQQNILGTIFQTWVDKRKLSEIPGYVILQWNGGNNLAVLNKRIIMTKKTHGLNKFQFLRNATVAIREPVDPPNMNVGYVPTWLRYLNIDPRATSGSLGSSASREAPTPLWLYSSTSCTNSSLVLLQEVITYSETVTRINMQKVSWSRSKNNVGWRIIIEFCKLRS